MPADEGYTYVDTAKLGEAARRGRERARELEEYLEDVKRWMGIVDTFWKGAAADAYTERYEGLIDILEHNLEAFCRYPAKLEQAVEQYEQADSQATQIAQGVEQAVWADV